MKKFPLRRGSHHVQPLNQQFFVSKDKWKTKEGTGKSMKMHCTLHTAVCQKAGKVM